VAPSASPEGPAPTINTLVTVGNILTSSKSAYADIRRLDSLVNKFAYEKGSMAAYAQVAKHEREISVVTCLAIANKDLALLY
jgi:hypothetical protein